MRNSWLNLTLLFLILIPLQSAWGMDLRVISNKNADFYLNDELIVTGKRVYISLDEKQNNVITAKAPGYQEKTHHLQANYHSKKISFVFLTEDKIGVSSHSNFQSEQVKTDQPKPQKGQGRNLAYLIGNSNYKDNETWSNLNTPKKDVKELSELLKNKFDFESVTSRYDLDRKSIYELFTDIIKNTQPNDSVFIYFAGHGHYDRELIETGYWVPSDAQGTSEFSLISNEDIQKRLATLSTKVRHVLLISDSCFSGNLLTRALKRKKQSNKKQFFKSAQVITSGSDQYVDDAYKNTGHSPFAYFTIRYLNKVQDKATSSTELFSYLNTVIPNANNQSPRFGPIQKAEHEGGDFFFFTK